MMHNNSTPTDLEAHPFNEDILYMTQSYRVYKSMNKGNTWENISGTLPEIPMNDIAFDLSSTEGLYVATDAGVYFKQDPGTDWIKWGDSLPLNVSVEEIEIYQDPESRDESRLRVGTYGRGLWECVLGPTDTFIPPGGLKLDTTHTGISLSWKAPFYNNEVTSYNIYKDSVLIGSSENLSYSDNELEDWVTHTYYVTALYNNDDESGPGNSVHYTLTSPLTLPYINDFENGDGIWVYKNSKTGWRYGTAEQFKMNHTNGNHTKFYGINSSLAGTGVHTTDYLISPAFDLHEYSNVTLSFDYLLRRLLRYDKLYIVYRISPNEDWTEIVELEPTGKWDSWSNFSIELPPGVMSADLELAFFYDDSDKKAYGAGIDNIQLYETASGIDEIFSEKNLKIYPNPNNGEFEVELTNDKPGELLISIYSLDGKKIFENNYNLNTNHFKQKIYIGDKPKGVYQLRLITDNKVINREVILN